MVFLHEKIVFYNEHNRYIDIFWLFWFSNNKNPLKNFLETKSAFVNSEFMKTCNELDIQVQWLVPKSKFKHEVNLTDLGKAKLNDL